MSKLLRTLQRIGKRAVKYHVEVIYRELELTCVERWQPNKLVVLWSHRSRHEQTSAHSLEPSIPQPSLGYVRWPPAGERTGFDITLYFDPFINAYDEKFWVLSIEEQTRNGERRVLAKLRVPLLDLAVQTTRTNEANVKNQPNVSDLKVNDVKAESFDNNDSKLALHTFELRPASTKITSAKLTVLMKVVTESAEAQELMPIVPPVTSAETTGQKNVEGNSNFRRGGLQRFSTRIRETFRHRRHPAGQSERLPAQSAAAVRAQFNPRPSQSTTPVEAAVPVTAVPQEPAPSTIPVAENNSKGVEESESINNSVLQQSTSAAVANTETISTEASAHVDSTKALSLNAEICTTPVATPSKSVADSVDNNAISEPQFKRSHTIDEAPTAAVPDNSKLPQAASIKVAAQLSSTDSSVINDGKSNTGSLSKQLSFACTEEEQVLLAWCKNATSNFTTVRITNFTTSFRNGLALCAIIQHYRPKLIDVTKLTAPNMLENNRRAFELASRYFGIAPLLDPTLMDGNYAPNKKAVIDYLMALRAYFNLHPTATLKEDELFLEDAAQLEVQDDSKKPADEVDDLVALRNSGPTSPTGDATHRLSGSKSSLLSSLKKRSTNSLHKILGSRTSNGERDVGADADESDRHKSALSTPEVDASPNNSAFEQTKHLHESESSHGLDAKSITGEQAAGALTTPIRSIDADRERRTEQAKAMLASVKRSDSSAPATPTTPLAVHTGTSTAFAQLPVALTPVESTPLSAAQALAAADTGSELHASDASPHKSPRLSKGFLTRQQAVGSTETPTAEITKPVFNAEPAAVTPRVRNSVIIGEKHEQGAEGSESMLSAKPSGAELAAELSKVESEMRDVEEKIKIVEERIRDAGQRRAKTLDRPSALPQQMSVDSGVSSRFGALGRSWSMRRQPTPADAAAQKAAALAAAEAEREDQVLVKQRLALTNRQNTLLHRLNRINLLHQDEELEKLHETLKEQLHDLSLSQDWQKTDEERLQEEKLTEDLLEVVRKRNQIVMDIDKNEQLIEEALELEETMRDVVLDGVHGEQCVIS